MTRGFVFVRPRGGLPTLEMKGARCASSGPIRIAGFGRLHSWQDTTLDLEAELAALARRIEAAGLRQALAPVDGEWSLVVEDDRTGRVSFVTDHVGTHPIFLCENDHGVTVASRLPALVRAARLSLDEDRVAVYLSRGKKDLLQPLFTGARRLGPRLILSVDANGAVSAETWFDWDTGHGIEPDFDELRGLILGAIACEEASLPGPIAGTLSAGLDCTILSMASRHTSGFRAYSIDAGPGVDNEMAEIDETVRLEDIRHDYVRSSFGLRQLLALVDECGEPIRELKSISTMFDCAARARADGMRSFLVGLGPDMIFAGGQMLVIPYIHGLVRRGAFRELARALPGLAKYMGTRPTGLISRYIAAASRASGGMMGSPGKASDGGHLKPAFARSCPVARPIDIKAFITQLLSGVAISPSVRAMEALTGLEFAAPLYSRRLAEYTLSCNPAWFMRGGATKAMMREALASELPRHVVRADIKKKVPHRSIDVIIFEPNAAPEMEALLSGSAVLRRMLVDDPVRGFRRGLAERHHAEFWTRCVQVAKLERLAIGAAASPASSDRTVAPAVALSGAG